MCDFPLITRFGFHSLCDNGIRSRSVPFHFGWRLLPYSPWGEEVPWLCMGKAAERPHAKEVLFDVFSLLPMGGETKPWGYRWGCYPWDQETTYQRGQYHANCEWVDPVRDIFLCNRQTLWQNAFYLYLGKSK